MSFRCMRPEKRKKKKKEEQFLSLNPVSSLCFDLSADWDMNRNGGVVLRSEISSIPDTMFVRSAVFQAFNASSC